MRLILILISFFSLTTFAKKNDPTISFFKNQKEVVLNSENYEIYEDKKHYKNLDELLEEPVNFEVNTESYRICKPHSTYWIRFHFSINDIQQNQYLFDGGIHSEDISIFFVFKDTLVKEIISGNQRPFSSREIDSRKMLFLMPVIDQTYTVYIRLKSTNYSPLDFKITRIEREISSEFTAYLIFGVFYGILILLTFYSLTLFSMVKKPVYIFYSLYLLSVILLSLAGDGLGFQYLWPDQAWFNPIASQHLGSVSMTIFFALYSQSFLKIPIRSQASKAINISLMLFFLYKAIALLFPDSIQYLPDFIILPYVVVYSYAVKKLLSGHQEIRFYVIGTTCILLALIILDLCLYGLLAWNSFTSYALNYGLVIEAIFMSIALGDKFRFVTLKKEKAQEKALNTMQENERLQKVLLKEYKEKTKINELIQKKFDIELSKKSDEMSKKVQNLMKSNNELSKSLFRYFKKIKNEDDEKNN